MKLVTVVGARPQFIKASAVSQELRAAHQEVLVHTGQHYDKELSAVFFSELGLPHPDYAFEVGSGPHGEQTGAMLSLIERVLISEAPDAVLVYGDTNSTLAGALAAAKLKIPIAHVEAGLRSFNRAMPEEINRVVTDHLSTWLFAPAAHAERQLAVEGIGRGVHVVGDIMLDAVLQHAERARTLSRYPEAANVCPGAFYLCTVHRAENTDQPERLAGILAGLAGLDRPVVLPRHPPTAERLKQVEL